MALKATIYKAQLQIADMDRGIYGEHALTLAQHPSETEERMMVRLLAYALNVPADNHRGDLVFARGLADTDEPDLWQLDLTGQLVHWIEVGQPDERRMQRAASRADQATFISYSASTPIWWAGVKNKLTRTERLVGVAIALRAERRTGRAGAAFDADTGHGAGRNGVVQRRPAVGRTGPAGAVDLIDARH